MAVLRLWWRDFLLWTLFNLAWLALQVPVITGPAATAALYVLARRAVEGELLSPRDGWLALRQVWWPGLRWGLANLLVLGVVVANFWAYQSFVGWAWTALRLAWGIIAVAWLLVNLFYWPFWLAQQDRRFLVTLRNSFLFLLRAPGLALFVALVSAALLALSVLLTLPLGLGLMAWLALLGTLAVNAELESLPPAARHPAKPLRATADRP